jgi:hypothetical protein
MTVKVFRSTDFGAPTNTNVVGALIAILDGCLVTGYGSQTATITRTDTTATVTLPVAHTLKSDTFVRIAGATQTDYNGDFAITVTGANTFTYQVANSPVTPATGTITSKVAPVDWTKPFSGTGIAAYKQGAGSNGFYLRVDNSFVVGSSNEPKIKAYASMLDINTGDGATPETYIPLNYSATPAQPWFLIATEKAFYLISFSGSNLSPFFFGDFPSKKSGDAFNTAIFGNSNYYNPSEFFQLSANLAATTQSYLLRNHSQIGLPVAAGRCAALSGTAMGNSVPQAYPSTIDGALHLSPIMITEPSGIRGTIPGLWCPLHIRPFANGDIVIGTGEFAGKKFLAITGGSSDSYQCLIEISNTW